MNVKLEINLDTLEAITDDESVTIVELKKEDNKIFLEVSKPDPEFTEINHLP